MFRAALLALTATSLLSCSAVSGFAQSAPAPAATQQQAPAAWQTALQQRRKELIAKNGPGTDTELRGELVQMRDEDQAARGVIYGSNAPKTPPESMAQLRVSDAKRTEELKQIVAAKGWPTIALVGIDASNGAMLVLTHTVDHAWLQQLLPQLQELADAGKIDASPLAMAVDKQLVAEGKLQRYGSQFMYIGGKISMYAVEDPGHLDDRRAEALLPPISVYKQQMAQMYHVEVSEDVVMAPAPAKK
jgi:hypothetical protein